MNEIRTSRLILETPEGKIKAILQAGSDEVVSLDLFGPAGTASGLSILIDSDGFPKINFTSPSGTTGLALALSPHMGSGIQLNDPAGRPVGFITVQPDGIPRIELYQVTSPNEATPLWSTPTSSNTEES